MDWLNEAKAVIEDVKEFVNRIKISEEKESSNMGIYFEIETLESEILLVHMSAGGFKIDDRLNEETNDSQGYETINALLFNSSTKYREKFAQCLVDKVNTLSNCRRAG